MDLVSQVIVGPDESELFTAMLNQESESFFTCKPQSGKSFQLHLNIRSLSRVDGFEDGPWIALVCRTLDYTEESIDHFVLYNIQTKGGFAFHFFGPNKMESFPAGAEEALLELNDFHSEHYAGSWMDSSSNALSTLRYNLYGLLIFLNGIIVSAPVYQYWTYLLGKKATK